MPDAENATLLISTLTIKLHIIVYFCSTLSVQNSNTVANFSKRVRKNAATNVMFAGDRYGS